MRIAYTILYVKLEGQKLLGNLDVGTTQKLILEKYGMRGQNEFKYIKIKPHNGVNEHRNKTLGCLIR
jgi:hypothetical protein